MKLWKSWSGIAFVIGALVFLPLRAAAAEWALARLAFSSGWDAVPAVVANERGFFAQEGLVVSGLAGSSTQNLINSLAAGSTDFAAVPQRIFLVMVALRSPVKVISANGWGTEMELLIPKDNAAVKSIGDLKGRTIAVGAGSEAYPVLIRLLNKARMRPTDVTTKSLSSSELTRVFQGKLADALLESRYFTSVVEKSGQGRVLLAFSDIVKSLGLIDMAPLVTRTALIEKDPHTVQNFVNAWIKALKYVQKDPEDAARLLQIFFHRQGVKVTDEKLVRSWIGMTHYDRFMFSSDEVADAEFNGWALKEGGVLKVLPKLDGYIENRFAQQALQSLQGGRSQPSKK